MIAAYAILYDDVPTAREKKPLKMCKRELTPCKWNIIAWYSWPVVALGPQNCLADVLQDSDRAYIKTHLPW